MLTVTARNKRHTHRSHHPEMLNNNIDDGFISAFATKKPLESSLSRERAAKEAEKITVPLRSRMRKSRKRCLVPMVIITILILSGLLSAVIFILVNPIQKGEYILNIHCKKHLMLDNFGYVELWRISLKICTI